MAAKHRINKKERLRFSKADYSSLKFGCLISSLLKARALRRVCNQMRDNRGKRGGKKTREVAQNKMGSSEFLLLSQWTKRKKALRDAEKGKKDRAEILLHSYAWRTW